MFGSKENVQAGGLISYGANYTDMHRRAATYIHKILKGAKPADLPVELASKYEMVINQKNSQSNWHRNSGIIFATRRRCNRMMSPPLCCCVAIQRRYEGPWSILDELIWSLAADISLRPRSCAVSYHHSLNVGSAHPPQTQGKVQSAVSFALSGMYRLQTEGLIGLIERQTTSKVPAEFILPIMAGFDRW